MTSETIDSDSAASISRPHAVPDAYVPSGRTTVLAVVLMAAVAAVSGPIAGAVVMLADQLISAIGEIAAASGEFPFLVVFVLALVAYAFGGAFVGSVQGKLIGKAGKVGRNRNPNLATLFGVVAAGAALAAFHGMRRGELGAEAFDSAIDWIKFALYGVGAVLGAAVASREPAERDPFCEACGTFLDVQTMATVPATLESQVIRYLQDGPPARILSLPTEPDPERDQTQVTLHFCPVCRNTGVLSAQTNIYRSEKGEDGTESVRADSRQVFSELISREVIGTLIDGRHDVAPVASARFKTGPDASSEMADAGGQPAVVPSIVPDCFTCGARPAATTSIVRFSRTPDFEMSSAADFLKDRGYLRTEGILVPRCRECMDGEKRIAVAGQVAAWTGIPAGFAVGIGAASVMGGVVGAVLGAFTFVAVVAAIMMWARRSGPADINSRAPADHAAAQLALRAGAKPGGWIIPKEGLKPDVLREADFREYEATLD